MHTCASGTVEGNGLFIMLRITQESEIPSEITLRLEGRLVTAWVGELERECLAWLAQGNRVLLDFSDVTFVDYQGAAMLKKLLTHNVEVINASPVILELLTEFDEQDFPRDYNPENPSNDY